MMSDVLDRGLSLVDETAPPPPPGSSTAPSQTRPDRVESTPAYEQEKDQYRQYFGSNTGRSGREEELRTSPLFSLSVKHITDTPGMPVCSTTKPVCSTTKPVCSTTKPVAPIFDQHALIGHHTGPESFVGVHEPILQNITAPNSTFICGSQGSGKSYTLACMLENCLLENNTTGTVSHPVAGVVFNYDTNTKPTVAEVTHLCSAGVPVQAFVSACNPSLRAAYAALSTQYPGKVSVQTLAFRSSDLTTERMNKLMAVSEGDRVPLYLVTVQKILREMAEEGSFSYADFLDRVKDMNLSRDQATPFDQRLALLESFMSKEDVAEARKPPDVRRPAAEKAGLFTLGPGSLTIIDLTDTFVDTSTACILFDICLGLIQENRPSTGLVVTLDEAHRFLTGISPAAETFTNSLLTTIRTQRHNGTLVIIATQEPTISEKLLDLCSVSIIHRFTSPAWFAAIKQHCCGASGLEERDRKDMFESIVDLRVGESLVFAPSSFVCVGQDGSGPRKLGAGAMRMKTRRRVGVDAGMSVLAERVDGVQS